MRMDDGYQTLITFANNPTVEFWEKTVTPPGVDGGDPTDTTTMHNTDWRTFAPKFLKTLTEAGATVSYSPEMIVDAATDMVNVNQLITITFPAGDTIQFWGYLRSFTPGENAEGEQPTAEIVIQPTNQNASGVETPPVYTPAA